MKSMGLCSGVMFAFIGISALVFTQGHTLGTAGRMGVGYIPTLVPDPLARLATIVRGVFINRTPVACFALRPLILVISAVVAFALLIDRPVWRGQRWSWSSSAVSAATTSASAKC